MSSENLTILVTGANRGIGFSIVQALAATYPNSTFILAGRREESLKEAVHQLTTEHGVKARLESVVLDVADETSIAAAVKSVDNRFGKLNVLVNNAGIAHLPKANATPREHADYFAVTFATNVTAVYGVTSAFLPLLRASQPSNLAAISETEGVVHHDAVRQPLVINISSGRASLVRSTTGGLPPTASISYSVSKTALNALTVEMGKAHADVKFYCINPGHCRTAFNNFRGARDPLEGAEVVVRLVEGRGAVDGGFWETVGAGGELVSVPW